MSHRTGATVDTPAACARQGTPDGLSKPARYSCCNNPTEGGVRCLLSHCRSGKAPHIAPEHAGGDVSFLPSKPSLSPIPLHLDTIYAFQPERQSVLFLLRL